MTQRGEELIALAASVTAAQRELSQISRQLDNYRLGSTANVVIQAGTHLTGVLTDIQTAIGQEATK